MRTIRRITNAQMKSLKSLDFIMQHLLSTLEFAMEKRQLTASGSVHSNYNTVRQHLSNISVTKIVFGRLSVCFYHGCIRRASRKICVTKTPSLHLTKAGLPRYNKYSIYGRCHLSGQLPSTAVSKNRLTVRLLSGRSSCIYEYYT